MMKKQRCAKSWTAGILTLGLLAGLCACGPTTSRSVPPPTPQEDILTQKVISPGKIPLTVLVKNAFAINTFEAAAEEKFPQLDLIQVGNYTSDMGIDEYAARLEHGDLTDLVMTWPLDVGEAYWEDALMDLSALPFTSKYATSMLNNIARDGKLYYLPGPSQVRAILYNKTLFQEKGWEVPTDFEGFLALCKEIEADGIRSLQLGLGNAEVLDTAFVGYGYQQSFASPENNQLLVDYNNGKGSFADNFMPALETFQRLIDEGVLKKEDLNVYYQDRERMLFTRQCAMVEDSVLLTRMGSALTGSTDEIALMPFFNPGTDADWARLYPVCYIGVNKELSQAQNKEKLGLTMELLEYISTPEGQLALGGDTGAMFSSLNGTSPPDIPEIKDLLPALSEGRYAIFPTLKNAQDALRQGLAGMVAGTQTAADVVKLVDQQNLSPVQVAPPTVLGQASSDFTLTETGNFITDAMRAQSGCEIALFLDNGMDGRNSGKGVSGKLYGGDVTTTDIKRILPDLKHNEKGVLWKVTMTGENLRNALEYSLEVDNDLGGWFYYFSGLKMTYAPAGEPGSRIKAITDGEGKELDPQRLYTVAIMDQCVQQEYLQSVEETDLLISDLLAQRIQTDGTITPSGDGRFTVSQP